ncbi:MAG TPA: hypothetical protein VNJ08_06960 [Bacteriovoracaceae bacterium]|nr:hypothetical protein [Bacteriovoracaceae bacterium]
MSEEVVGRVENKIQDRFFVDVSGDEKSLELVHGLLREANNKKFGRKLILKDLVMVGLGKLNQKDVERIKNASLGPADLVRRKADQYNEAHGTEYDMYEYIEAMITTGRSIL